MANPHQELLVDLHADVLPKKTHVALAVLADRPWVSDGGWYLAGGTALALQMGHRMSIDLDFFTTEARFSEADLTETCATEFAEFGWQETMVEKGTVYGELCGAKISFIAYPFLRLACLCGQLAHCVCSTKMT